MPISRFPCIESGVGDYLVRLKIMNHLNILLVHLSRGSCDDPFGIWPEGEGQKITAFLDTFTQLMSGGLQFARSKFRHRRRTRCGKGALESKTSFWNSGVFPFLIVEKWRARKVGATSSKSSRSTNWNSSEREFKFAHHSPSLKDRGILNITLHTPHEKKLITEAKASSSKLYLNEKNYVVRQFCIFQLCSDRRTSFRNYW